MKLIFV